MGRTLDLLKLGDAILAKAGSGRDGRPSGEVELGQLAFERRQIKTPCGGKPGRDRYR